MSTDAGSVAGLPVRHASSRLPGRLSGALRPRCPRGGPGPLGAARHARLAPAHQCRRRPPTGPRRSDRNLEPARPPRTSRAVRLPWDGRSLRRLPEPECFHGPAGARDRSRQLRLRDRGWPRWDRGGGEPVRAQQRAVRATAGFGGHLGAERVGAPGRSATGRELARRPGSPRPLRHRTATAGATQRADVPGRRRRTARGGACRHGRGRRRSPSVRRRPGPVRRRLVWSVRRRRARHRLPSALDWLEGTAVRYSERATPLVDRYWRSVVDDRLVCVGFDYPNTEGWLQALGRVSARAAAGVQESLRTLH